MSEKQREPSFESIIKREDRPYAIEAGNVYYPTSLFTTVVFQFPPEMSAFNFAVIDHPDGTCSKLYDIDPHTLDILHEKGYTFVTPPWPNEDQEREFFEVEHQYAQHEFKEFEKSGEL